MPRPKNKEFELCGVNHLALVCKDMAKTVEFYSGVLGMPLIKTLDLPMGMGQHFFFDCGNGDAIAFFWFPNAPEGQPGLSAPRDLPGTRGSIVTAHGSMNHIALNVPAEKFDEYVERLKQKGIEVSPVLNHDESPMQVSATVNDTTFVRSVYFFDPDGICLEFAAWTRDLPREGDVKHQPATAQDAKRYREMAAAK